MKERFQTPDEMHSELALKAIDGVSRAENCGCHSCRNGNDHDWDDYELFLNAYVDVLTQSGEEE